MTETSERSALGSIFDRTLRSLNGIPDAACTKASTVRSMHPVLEIAQTFIVQTYRHKERGDTVFIEYIGTEGSMRVALPPEVAEVIARQRDALTTKNRKRSAREQAAARKAAGIQPAFLKAKKRTKKG
jgi:hypothetical protein